MLATTYAEGSAPSPFGAMRIVATERGVAYVRMPGERPERFVAWAARRLADATPVDDPAWIAPVAAQLGEYFAGARRSFDLPLDLAGTPFQRRVWDALLRIPFGETRSYADVAREVGRPGAERAVGAANGANVLSVIVPCHRVVGSRGELTGYAGGLPKKARLLRHERAFASQTRLPA